MRRLVLPGQEAKERWRTSSGSAAFAPPSLSGQFSAPLPVNLHTHTSHFCLVVVCVCACVWVHTCVRARACLFKNVFVRKKFLTTF